MSDHDDLNRDRLEMIRIVCAAMEQQFGARPARRQIAEVAREMVARYPQSLRDEPGEATVFGEKRYSTDLQFYPGLFFGRDILRSRNNGNKNKH